MRIEEAAGEISGMIKDPTTWVVIAGSDSGETVKSHLIAMGSTEDVLNVLFSSAAHHAIKKGARSKEHIMELHACLAHHIKQEMERCSQ
jgi:hypothetical protein